MKKKRIAAGVLLAGSILLAACAGTKEEILIEQPDEVLEEAEETAEKEPEDAKTVSVWIDIGGAVKNPGVYELAEGARIFEAVKAAGGLTDDADPDWLNQAAPAVDGSKIQVYTKEETAVMKEQGKSGEVTESSASEDMSSEKIDINAASLAGLQEIPGIGEVRAQAILSYREQNGKFKNIEEIQKVSGIKGKTFDKIKDYITVK